MTSLQDRITFRRVTENDIHILVEIERESFAVPWPADAFYHDIQHNRFAAYIMIELDGQVAGYCGVWIILDEAHITNLAVHPDFRRKGVAKLLLFDALEQCYKEKIKYLTLEVRVSNEGAINLYESFGFKSLGVRKKYYQNNNEDALIMWSENIFSENYKKRFNKIKEDIEGLILK